MRYARTINYLLLTTAISTHIYLCMPATNQRGYPPLDPFLEFIAPYPSIFLIFFLAPLNRHLPRTDIWTRRIGFALFYSIGLGGALQFQVFGHAIPNHGPYLLDTLTIALIVFLPTIVVMRLVDRLANKLVSRWRSGNSSTPEPTTVSATSNLITPPD